jgi:hypothetical protein
MLLSESAGRSRAIALFATLALHVVAALWLLALRFDLPERLTEELSFIWTSALPEALPPPPPPVASELPPPEVAPIRAAPLPVPEPDVRPAAPPDWSSTARSVAEGLTTEPSYRRFGEFPKGPQERPSEQYPPSIFDKPLPRVGTTVTTAEGETIIWVSDYCYVSISSRSLTQKDVHDARKGVRTCILAQFGGKKQARSDLFNEIKRPPPPKEPGCNREGIGLSCAR